MQDIIVSDAAVSFPGIVSDLEGNIVVALTVSAAHFTGNGKFGSFDYRRFASCPVTINGLRYTDFQLDNVDSDGIDVRAVLLARGSDNESEPARMYVLLIADNDGVLTAVQGVATTENPHYEDWYQAGLYALALLVQQHMGLVAS